MKKKILLISLSIMVILALVAPGCIPKKAGTAQNPTDTERIAALESTVSQLQSKVASLPAPKDYSGELAALSEQLASLQAAQKVEVADLQERITALEEEEAAANEESDNITRWRYALMWHYSSGKVNVEVTYVSPSRIDEAGDYRIYLGVANYELVEVKDLVIDLTFTPESGDRVCVDEKNTYLDTINAPYTLWNVDLVERGDENYCRRITCMSEPIYLGKATAVDDSETPEDESAPYTWTFKLEFSLAYE